MSDLLYNANFTIVPSDKFSEVEIRDAMYCVIDKFEDAFKGCELTKLGMMRRNPIAKSKVI